MLEDEDTKTAVKYLAKEDAAKWIDLVWKYAYKAGVTDTEKQLANKDQTTTLTQATEEQKKTWNHFRLEVFCDKCESGIGEHFGLYTFCPYCGRKIIRKDT